ncbi:MAG: hypothetical protein CVU56_13010 [Deltaproteobacteria bacterium HGW-Deltaproteobacteria-14]|jgi:xanthine dehydrogenase accessory factor|nr:MAG: hypothetical protein CVU56_13010 [Deltaproteobacteria bacterium HGW-Deltaproteobacteria-14]
MSDVTLLRQLADLIDAGTPCATAQIVRATGSIPNELGATMLVGPGGELLAGTVGGGAIEAGALEATAKAIAAGKSQLYSTKLTEHEAGGIGMMCGGSCDVFIAVHNPAPRLLLLGAGHVNRCLARLADGLGYRITVVDDRPEWANADNYPHAELVLAQAEDAIPTLGVDRHTFIVVATRDRDTPAVAAASKTSARYIGVVASKRKAIQLVKDIADRVDLDALVPRLHAPIGLRLGGRSPEAVALSILAEIQALQHDVQGDSMRLPPEKLLCYVPTASRS